MQNKQSQQRSTATVAQRPEENQKGNRGVAEVDEHTRGLRSDQPGGQRDDHASLPAVWGTSCYAVGVQRTIAYHPHRSVGCHPLAGCTHHGPWN